MAEVCYTKIVFMSMLCPERASRDSLDTRCFQRMGCVAVADGWNFQVFTNGKEQPDGTLKYLDRS